MNQGKTHPIVLIAGAAVLVFSLLGAAALTGVLPVAGGTGGTGGTESSKPAFSSCPNCGVVEAIRAVEVKGQSTGIGAVAGGVAGGVVGNQIGQGGARTLLTIGGAAGGAFAGDAIEKNLKKHTAWRVTVRMNDGTRRDLSRHEPPPFAVGERVRVVDGNRIERA